MTSLFFDGRRALRNGWRVAGFLAITAVMLAVLLGMRTMLPASLVAYLPKVLIIFLAILAASWICTRLERIRLADIGLAADARFARLLGVGIATGAAMVAVSAAAIWLLDGFHLQPSPAASLARLGKSASMMLAVAAIETLVFCGYPFQRAIRGMGEGKALVLFALLFCAGHLVDPEMGIDLMILAMVNLFLAGLLFGYCYLKTRSLALATGVHMGWNWMQETLGFSVSGNAAQGWWAPVYHGQPEWLTGGAFGLEASLVDVVLLAVMVGVAARWHGATRDAASVRLAGSGVPGGAAVPR